MAGCTDREHWIIERASVRTNDNCMAGASSSEGAPIILAAGAALNASRGGLTYIYRAAREMHIFAGTN